MMTKFITFVLIAFMSASCSSLFYWPTSALYSDPWQEDIPYQNIFFESEDGTLLHSWLLTHKGAGASKGLITFFHGNAQNLTSHAPILSWLTKSGYDLFIFDYRGYGLSEGAPSPSRIALDARAALAYSRLLKTQLKAPRWILYGQSLGGAILGRAIALDSHQEDADLLVLDSTFESYYELAREKLLGAPILYPLYPLLPFLIPDQYDSAPVLSKITIPTLVIHGEQDQIIPLQHGQEIFKRLTTQKWFWSVPRGGHIDGFFVDEGRLKSQFLDFLAKQFH